MYVTIRYRYAKINKSLLVIIVAFKKSLKTVKNIVGHR